MASRKRQVVGIDVDGVLADFLGSARKALRALYGKPEDSAIQTSWAFSSLGITEEETKGFWDYVDAVPNWWMRLQKMPNTYLVADIERSHRVVFITHRFDGAGSPVEDQTKEWLTRSFGIKNPTVVLSGDKGPVAKGLKLDWFIDDRPENVWGVVQDAPKCNAFIYDGTYNRDGDILPASVPRIANFDEFAKLIKQEAQ